MSSQKIRMGSRTRLSRLATADIDHREGVAQRAQDRAVGHGAGDEGRAQHEDAQIGIGHFGHVVRDLDEREQRPGKRQDRAGQHQAGTQEEQKRLASGAVGLVVPSRPGVLGHQSGAAIAEPAGEGENDEDEGHAHPRRGQGQGAELAEPEGIGQVVYRLHGHLRHQGRRKHEEVPAKRTPRQIAAALRPGQ